MTKRERLEATMRRWAAVDACLATLPTAYFEAVIGYYQGTSVAALAAELKVSPCRVRSILERALARLEDMLVDDVPETPVGYRTEE